MSKKTEKGRVILIHDQGESFLPLRLSRRKAHDKKSARILIKCGCCNERLEIYFDDKVIHEQSLESPNTLEIGGVMGTIDQWRKILLPLLDENPSK